MKITKEMISDFRWSFERVFTDNFRLEIRTEVSDDRIFNENMDCIYGDVYEKYTVYFITTKAINYYSIQDLNDVYFTLLDKYSKIDSEFSFELKFEVQ